MRRLVVWGQREGIYVFGVEWEKRGRGAGKWGKLVKRSFDLSISQSKIMWDVVFIGKWSVMDLHTLSLMGFGFRLTQVVWLRQRCLSTSQITKTNSPSLHFTSHAFSNPFHFFFSFFLSKGLIYYFVTFPTPYIYIWFKYAYSSSIHYHNNMVEVLVTHFLD